MPRITFDSRLKNKRLEYAQKYDIDDLTSGNDRANLDALLRNEIILEDLQAALQEKVEEGAANNIAEIKKLNDGIRDLINTNLSLERALGIDRAARKKEVNDQSPAEYIKSLKQQAKEFLEQRLIKVYCEECKVLVMRFLPVHEHTKFKVECKCSQCGKMIRVHREDKDIFFDLPAKDREWRRKYPAEIVQAKINTTTDDIDSEDDEVIIGGE